MKYRVWIRGKKKYVSLFPITLRHKAFYMEPDLSRLENYCIWFLRSIICFPLSEGAKPESQLMIYLQPYILAVKTVSSWPALRCTPIRIRMFRLWKRFRVKSFLFQLCQFYRAGVFSPLLLSAGAGLWCYLSLLLFHSDYYNLWPSLQTPSSPPQMFDFNLLLGKNLWEWPPSWDSEV